METIPTSPTLLTRNPSIFAHNTIANRAFRLALQRAEYIASPRKQTVDDAVIAERDDGLRIAQPSVPAALIDSHGFVGGRADFGVVQGEGRREGNNYDGGLPFVVHGVRGDKFGGAMIKANY
jgi:hypothetical protein